MTVTIPAGLFGFRLARCVILRLFYSLAEMHFERDWPRSTWRGLLVSLGLLWLCASVFA